MLLLHGKPCSRKPRWLIGFMKKSAVRKLKLSDEQWQQLDNLINRIDKGRREIERINREKHQLMHEILAKPTIDKKSALHLINMPMYEFKEHAAPILDEYSLFHQSLSEEQRQALLRWWQKHTSSRWCYCH